jgi:signal transduction histidine kinase
MGSAISGMHYIGMAAMRLPAVLTWRTTLVVASVAIAITASFAALLLACRLRGGGAGLFRWTRTWAAILMGVAIAGMHYTAMAAAQFTPVAIDLHTSHLSLHTSGLAVAVTIATFVILSVALAGAAIDDREQLLAREQLARHHAEAASRLKDEFLATLSHELRTPLNVIVGRTHMLRVEANDPVKVRQMADAIAHNGELLRRLVEDLLDVSRITVGGLQLDCRPVDLPVLVDTVITSVQPAADAKGIRLRASRSQFVPQVIGDSIRLQQVIWNLLTNAIKFTSSGGEVSVKISVGESGVVMTVTDTGQGIDPAFLPYVFDMFRQGEAPSSRTHGGLGLGLSIVHRLVELHGGTVTAASGGAGRGAIFTVSLPSHQPATARSHVGSEVVTHG